VKARALGVVVAAAMALVLVVGVASAGPNPFSKLTTTAGGHHTWDSDQVDVELVSQTGAGVYVAVLDTGLVPNYRDYFPGARVAEKLGTGFEQQLHFSPREDPCDLSVEAGALKRTTWVGSTGSTHGTHVASTVLGYFYRSNFDALGGFPLPPIVVRGIAPDVTVIPVKVLADYQLPSRPKCTDPNVNTAAQKAVFGTDAMVAAGIDYVTGLANKGVKPIVINMSLGDDVPGPDIEDAIDRAIAAGVIVVASAGNEGENGMGWPGAYPQVISAGASGWTGEWLPASATARYRMWWLKDGTPATLTPPLLPGSGDVADPTSVNDVYVTDFSSREFAGQELDVLAPGSWVRGPFPGTPGFAHLPWHSSGIGDLVSVGNPSNFFYVGGTSMASPHVASAAAMVLQKNPGLGQAQVEAILKGSALAVPATGTRNIFDILTTPPAVGSFIDIGWDTDCDGTPCDAVGSGLLQVDGAIAATPAP
jgi:subtilisin family serine protease